MELTLVRRHFRVIVCVAAALLAGCKSGVERDVVQRQMRKQEDQIYALEDYLSEYQQLLCDARNENAALKRQLVQGQFKAGSANRPSASDQIDTLPSPSSTPPAAPATTEPEVDSNVAPPDVPPLDLETPSVPPLNDQSAIEPEVVAREVQPASAEIEVASDPATDVVLRGEVLLDDAENGPRVLVTVEPMTDAGEKANYRGRLSLMVLDPAARAKEQQLARWDFTPEELDAMATVAETGIAYEFPLQLPVDAPADRPLELWVRLNPEDGEKILGRTTMDLSRAGSFASAEVQPVEKKLRRPLVQAASAEVPVKPKRVVSRRRRRLIGDENGWRTAKPGDVAVPPATKQTVSQWKLATRPVPEVESTPVAKQAPDAGGDRYQVAERPQWSPEREVVDSAGAAAEPSWSPTR